MSRRLMVFGLSLLTGSALSAATHYVDCNLTSYEGHDGSSWTLAHKTIQEGVNACSAGDTVLVAAGRYAEGGGLWDGGLNRVLVETRDITIRGVAGKAETFIVGAHAANPVDEYGNGPDAVRCVRLAADNVVIEGFTLTDGASQPSFLREDAERANGGAVCSANSGYSSCLVDCVVTNCTGVRGGATCNAVLVRCLLVGNSCSGKGAAGNNSRFLNCVLTRNWGIGGGSLCCNCTVVSCTIVRNATSYVGSEGASFRNCLAILNAGIGDAPEQSYLKLQALCSVFPAREKASGVTYFRSEDGSSFDPNENQLVNPLFDDWRLKPGSAGVGRGNLDYYGIYSFWMPERIDRFVDFAGQAIPTSGPINAGAVQAVGPACEGGWLQFDQAGVCVDGAQTFVANEYVNATNYPQQFLVGVPPADGKRLFGFKRFGPGVSTYLFTRPDDTIWMLPPKSGCYTNEVVWSQNVLYVAPSGSDENDGRAADRPLKTIQAAVDKVSSSSYIISCAAGVYDDDDGCKEMMGMKNRVTISPETSVRIVGAGVGQSVLKGASDPDRTDGRGPQAMRCLLANTSYGSCIQGFTLTGGRCGSLDDDGVGGNDQGAGVFSATRTFQILDCEISDCKGVRGAVYNGVVMRSRITGCFGTAGGLRYAKLVSCVVDDNDSTGSSAMVSYNGEYHQCTLIGKDTSDLLVHGSGIPVVNSVVWRLSGLPAGCTDIVGTYVGNAGGPVLSGIDRDPMLVDPTDGDYRLLTCSPAFGGAVEDSFAANYSPDIDGRPVLFKNGKPTCGAVQSLVQGLSVTGGNGVKFTNGGTRALAPGETVVVTYDESEATRPVAGFRVNGVEQGFPENPQWTFTAPAAGEPLAEGFSLEPIFTSDWYVDANAPDNGGNGFRPETAKKSFHGAGGVFETGLVKAWDYVHVAPGTYVEGAKAGQDGDVANRVVVPANVRLVATEGPERTFIVGATATTGEVDAIGKGRGEDAVRCVYLNEGARLQGFTVTGGRTSCQDSGESGYGGGVYSVDTYAMVVDCVVSNNAAQRGGGMHRGTAVNCRFFDNWANANRAAMSEGRMAGCIVDRNRGVNTSQNTVGLWNCTFGADNTDLDGKPTNLAGMPYGPVVNCLFKGCFQIWADQWTPPPPSCTNCVFGSVDDYLGVGVFVDCQTCPVAEIALDDAYAPVIGTCAAVDAGYADAEAIALGGGTDVRGGQRIYNGRIDVGAVEADWRPHYAAALGSGVSVLSVSPDAVLADGRLRLPPDAAVVGCWRQLQPGRKTRYSYSLRASDGTLAGQLGDARPSVTDTAETYSFKTILDEIGFEFAFDGTGFGELFGFDQFVTGFTAIVR